jgi:protein-tyrosine phosphatase
MLRGSLDDFSLEDIFWLVARAENTGELMVVRPSGAGRVFFRSGRVYFAESELCREDVGRTLVRTGALGPDELAAADEESSSSGRSLSEVLLSSESVSQGQLDEAFQNQIEEISFELLRREFGEFSWESEVKAEPEFSVELTVDDVLAASETRVRQLERIRKIIPSDQSPFSIAPSPAASGGSITVSIHEWRLLSLIDGRSSAADIGREAGLNDLSVLQMLHDLVQRGLLEIHTRSETAEESPKVTSDRPFDVAFVCTGNRIRSPLAAAFLKGALPGQPLTVSSVGTSRSHPHPAEPEAIEAAAQLGADLSSHRSQALSEADLSQADLVIGFERKHLAKALESGARPERTFSIVELVDLLEKVDAPDDADPAARAREAIARAHDRRRLSDSVPPKIEIEDPMGANASAYRNTAIRLRDLSRRLATGLFGVSEL